MFSIFQARKRENVAWKNNAPRRSIFNVLFVLLILFIPMTESIIVKGSRKLISQKVDDAGILGRRMSQFLFASLLALIDNSDSSGKNFSRETKLARNSAKRTFDVFVRTFVKPDVAYRPHVSLMFPIDKSLALIALYAYTCSRECLPLPSTNPFEYPKKSSPAAVAIIASHMYKVQSDDDDN
jgi:hypothetical protein